MASLIATATRQCVAYIVCHPVLGMTVAALMRDQIPHMGCVIDTSAPVVDPRNKARLFWGTYERPETTFVHRYLRSDLDVLELGSGIGVLSCHIVRKLDPARRLVCVEADSGLHESIRNNIQRNCPGANGRVSVVHAALDYTEPRRSFVELCAGRDHTVTRVTDGPNAGGGTRIRVPATTLIELARQNDMENFSLVADVEGAEMGLLFADGEALRGCQQMIVELHDAVWNGRTRTVQEASTRAHGLGFTSRDRKGNVFVFERVRQSAS